MYIKYLVCFIIMFLFAFFYKKIAEALNIVDKPNHRSTHYNITVRGGGIIFVLSVLLYGLFFKHNLPLAFFIAFFSLSFISYIDDIRSLPASFRFLFHIISLGLVFWEFAPIILESYNYFFLVLFYIWTLALLNIYNFMDGINGNLFLNGLISLITLLIVNDYLFHFVESSFLVISIISILIFGFFNFRKKAYFFAGDVGSIAVGFILIFLILKLFFEINNPIVLLLFGTFFIDGGMTIMKRLINKQNIFKPHKLHLYHRLFEVLNFSHLKISTYYFIGQMIVNATVIGLLYYGFNSWSLTFSILIICIIFYFYLYNYISKHENQKKIQ